LGQVLPFALPVSLDGGASCHHDGVMRTTVNLPADLQNAVASIAAHSRKSMNQTVADLIRRALAQPATPVDAAAAKALVRVDEATGLPTIRSPRPVSAEDVRALEDD